MQKTRQLGQEPRTHSSTSKLLKLKQFNFKGWMYHLHSHRSSATQQKEMLLACPTLTEEGDREEPLLELQQSKLGSFIRGNLNSLDCLILKDGQCRTRQRYIEMVNWLKASLEGLERLSEKSEISQEAVYEYLNKVYGACLAEIIKQTSTESAEKAHILKLVWDNLMELSLWLDNYYRNRLVHETSKHALRCDEESRKFLFEIQELRDEVAKYERDRQRKDKHFYEVVKDNRKLRRHNNKLFVKLRYEGDGNHNLKEQNLRLYKENEKMKLVISQENQASQLQVLARRLREVEKRILNKKKMTKGSVLKEIKEEEVKEKLEEEIKMIVQRIDEEDLLDLDYYEPPKDLPLCTEYTSVATQTERNTYTRATNTYIDIAKHTHNPIAKDTQTEQTRLLQIKSSVLDIAIVPRPKRQSIRERPSNVVIQHIQPTTVRGGPKVHAPVKESPFGSGRGSIRLSNEAATQMKHHTVEARTYQEKAYRLYSQYEGICKVIENMRMVLLHLNQHQRIRVGKDLKIISQKTYSEFKNMMQASLGGGDAGLPLVKYARTNNSEDTGTLQSPNLQSDQQVPCIADELGGSSEEFAPRRPFRRKLEPQNISNSKAGFQLKQGSGDPLLVVPRLSMTRNSPFRPTPERRDDTFGSYNRTLSQNYPTKNSGTAAQNRTVRELLTEENSENEVCNEPGPSKLKKISNRMSRIHVSHQQQNQRDIPNILQASTERATGRCQDHGGIEEFVTSELGTVEEAAPNRITVNFSNREELMKYFLNAARGDDIKPEGKQTSSIRIVRSNEYRLEELSKKAGFVACGIDEPISAQLGQVPLTNPINSILSRIEKALCKNEKELQACLKEAASSKFYTKNTIHKLFSCLFKEIYKQRAKLLTKDIDFAQFFREWVVCRYGLQDIYDTVLARFKATLSKHADEQTEFKCLAMLMNCRQHKSSGSYLAGLFRLFTLFVQFGTESNDMLRGDSYNPNISCTQLTGFLQELLTVYFNEQDCKKLVGLIGQQLWRQGKQDQRANLFEALWLLESHLSIYSENGQLAQLVAAMSKILMDCTCETLSLEELLVLWRIINPAEPQLETNILRLIRFCRLAGAEGNQKLVLPLYKLNILSRKFGWDCLLRPIDFVNRRFDECYEGKTPMDTIALEHELSQLRSSLADHQEVVALLDSKLQKHRRWSRSKDIPFEPFPVLLYKLTKLCLANAEFDRHSDGLLDVRLTGFSHALDDIERKRILLSIGKPQ